MRIHHLRRAASLAAGIVLVGAGVALADGGWLGVRLQTIDDDLREALDLARSDHVLVSDVAEDSPAEDAGLEEGDVIVMIDGEDVETASDVVHLIRDLDPGDEVPIVVIRDGERETLAVVLDERPADEGFSRMGRRLHRVRPHVYHFRGDDDLYLRNVPGLEGLRGLRGLHGLHDIEGLADLEALEVFFGKPRLGVETRALDDALAGYFEVDEGEGVLVLSVMEDSPAEEVGIQVGDVIMEVDDAAIDSPGDLRDAVLDHEGETVSIRIRRHGEDLTLDVELDEPERWEARHPLGRARELSIEREGLQSQLEELREQLRDLREQLRELEQDR